MSVAGATPCEPRKRGRPRKIITCDNDDERPATKTSTKRESSKKPAVSANILGFVNKHSKCLKPTPNSIDEKDDSFRLDTKNVTMMGC